MSVRYCLLAASLLAAPLRAQAPPPQYASPYVPAGHWTLAAVRRAVGLGLAPRELGWDDGTMSRRRAALLLDAAAGQAEAEGHPAAAMMRGYVRRFAEELPATAAAALATGHARVGEGAAALGIGGRSGILGTSNANWVSEGGGPPRALGNYFGPQGEVTWAASFGRHAALSLAPRSAAGDWRPSEGYALAGWGPAAVWAGRRALRYGAAVGGGILFNPVGGINAAGLVVEPARLPSFLRHVGPVRFEATLGRIDSSNAIRHPWIMALHGSFSPHPRLLIAGNIGSMMSGSGRPPLTLRNVFEVLAFARAKRNTGGVEFENSLVSGEVRFRVPTRVPLLAYVEWGSEDNRGAWWSIPGAVGGVELSALPGFPALALGAEYTRFGPPCATCDENGLFSEWYRHYVYQGGWALDPVPLGHPLGGNGVEVTVFARYDALDARLRLDGRVFHRERDYFNLFAPDREGRSVGAVLEGSWRARPNLDVELETSLEEGARDWRQATLFAGARFLF
jgi:hypothetical protein